jgi:glycosyltransferase involved in cell wall biosynthesis
MVKDPKISIIITARNYSKFLPEAIESCLRQTVKPHEIIYSDDCSGDDSISIADGYGLIVVKHEEHVGVVKARNDGVSISSGDILVHMDGDDIFPDDYLEKHLETFDEETPFVYGAAQAFGKINVLWKVYTWDDLFLWDRNFVNTSAMMWKNVFLKSGGWKDTQENTMWDWSLALRMSRLGKPKKSPAILLYRQHDDSWSNSSEKVDGCIYFNDIILSVRRQIVNVTIGLVYSGRVPGLMDKWMDSLVRDISILNNKPEFIIINNSGEKIAFTEGYEDYFSEIKIITGRGKFLYKDENDRRNKVCELLAECYNKIIENATGELIHLREDDIIPEKKAFEDIFDFVTGSIPVVPAVSGTYLNRNTKRDQYVGGYYNMMCPRATSDIRKMKVDIPFKVDFSGTGFLIFWKRLCPLFKPYVDGIQAHDWAWGLKLKQMGRDLYMIPNARCRHYKNEEEYIVPKVVEFTNN